MTIKIRIIEDADCESGRYREIEKEEKALVELKPKIEAKEKNRKTSEKFRLAVESKGKFEHNRRRKVGLSSWICVIEREENKKGGLL